MRRFTLRTRDAAELKSSDNVTPTFILSHLNRRYHTAILVESSKMPPRGAVE
jgi:hypothetical protein